MSVAELIETSVVAPSEDEEYPDNTVDAKENAEQAGFEVIVADDYMLTIDVDTAGDRAQYDRMKHRIGDYVDVANTEEWESKSGNLHVLIRMKDPKPIIERIALQAIFGSDRKREALALRGVKNGAEFPLMLFRPRAKATA